jgi:hypothetical protein
MAQTTDNRGVIERVEDDVAWGTLNDGSTFDIPCFGYTVGDEVIKNIRDEDDEDEFGDVSFILSNGQTATVVIATYEDEGLEIIYVETFHKGAN